MVRTLRLKQIAPSLNAQREWRCRESRRAAPEQGTNSLASLEDLSTAIEQLYFEQNCLHKRSDCKINIVVQNHTMLL